MSLPSRNLVVYLLTFTILLKFIIIIERFEAHSRTVLPFKSVIYHRFGKFTTK